MSVARKLEELARLVPGVSGYQDREAWRESDKIVRLRLCAGLEQIRRDVEELQRRLVERRECSLLPALGQVAAKLDKVANQVKFAARGYRGLFDSRPIDEETLARLCAFDERLLDEIRGLEARSAALLDAHREAAILDDIRALEDAVDAFERRYLTRADVATGGRG
jgi:hypothetical protein